MIELFLFLLVTGCVVSWWQLMQGRQKARKAADQVCSNHSLQLLDDTVSLSSITWNRHASNSHLLVTVLWKSCSLSPASTVKPSSIVWRSPPRSSSARARRSVASCRRSTTARADRPRGDLWAQRTEHSDPARHRSAGLMLRGGQDSDSTPASASQGLNERDSVVSAATARSGA